MELEVPYDRSTKRYDVYSLKMKGWIITIYKEMTNGEHEPYLMVNIHQ